MTDARTDESLLHEFLAGRSAALGELARRYERPLLGLARGLLGGRRDLACDAVQETWLRVIRFGRNFNGRSRFKTWLYRIGVNQCRTLMDSAAPAAGEAGLAYAATRDPPPDRSAAGSDERTRLAAAVAALDLEKRVVVLLCYHGGLTHEEAAEILGLPLGTLKSRLHAALEALRAALGKESTP